MQYFSSGLYEHTTTHPPSSPDPDTGMCDINQVDQKTEVNDCDIGTLHNARSKIKHKHQASSKRSLSRHGPLNADLKLKTRKPSAENHSYDNQRELLLVQLEAVQELPKNSTYAKHRKACLQKAIVLLELNRCQSQDQCHFHMRRGNW